MEIVNIEWWNENIEEYLYTNFNEVSFRYFYYCLRSGLTPYVFLAKAWPHSLLWLWLTPPQIGLKVDHEITQLWLYKVLSIRNDKFKFWFNVYVICKRVDSCWFSCRFVLILFVSIIFFSTNYSILLLTWKTLIS